MSKKKILWLLIITSLTGYKPVPLETLPRIRKHEIIIISCTNEKLRRSIRSYLNIKGTNQVLSRWRGSWGPRKTTSYQYLKCQIYVWRVTITYRNEDPRKSSILILCVKFFMRDRTLCVFHQNVNDMITVIVFVWRIHFEF